MLRFDASVAKDLFCHLLAGVSYLATRVFSGKMQTEQNDAHMWEILLYLFMYKNKHMASFAFLLSFTLSTKE